ncbi:MAG: hypothetical protein ACWGSQ_17080 [Longimicrobiales bacterium]
MGEIFVLLLMALLAALVAYGLSLEARNRRVALEFVARGLGLDFDPGVDRSTHRAFGHSLFKKGKSRQATNNIYGVMKISGYSVRVRMADYRYDTGSGKSRQTHRISFACFLLPFVGTPDLLIRTEGLGDKLLGGLGFDDIDFESEEFSRRFWVKSGDKRHAYDVIHPGMMEFLLEGPTPQVEIVNDVCLILEGTRRWDPDTFEGAVGWFGEFLRLWPVHLTEQLQPRQGRSE